MAKDSMLRSLGFFLAQELGFLPQVIAAPEVEGEERLVRGALGVRHMARVMNDRPWLLLPPALVTLFPHCGSHERDVDLLGFVVMSGIERMGPEQ